jgi:hypothetical protein
MSDEERVARLNSHIGEVVNELNQWLDEIRDFETQGKVIRARNALVLLWIECRELTEPRTNIYPIFDRPIDPDTDEH